MLRTYFSKTWTDENGDSRSTVYKPIRTSKSGKVRLQPNPQDLQDAPHAWEDFENNDYYGWGYRGTGAQCLAQAIAYDLFRFRDTERSKLASENWQKVLEVIANLDADTDFSLDLERFRGIVGERDYKLLEESLPPIAQAQTT